MSGEFVFYCNYRYNICFTLLSFYIIIVLKALPIQRYMKGTAMDRENNLFNIFDKLDNMALFIVAQTDFKILYCNRYATQKSGLQKGDFYKPDTLNCEAINLHQGNYQYFAEQTVFGINMDINVKVTVWKTKSKAIPALAISVMPHIFAGEMQILHDHTNDLLQGIDVMFDEYVVVDLVDDQYIAPKFGPGAQSMPRAGEFSTANRLYAQMLIHPEDQNKFLDFTSLEAMRKNLLHANMHLTGELRRINAKGNFEWIEMHLLSTIDTTTGHLKAFWGYRNIEKQKQFELSQRE